MKLRLILKGPDRLSSVRREFEIDADRDGSYIIGRADSATWSIRDPERVLSKSHCQINVLERKFLLTDLSTNGVRINSIPVSATVPHELVHGDIIELADAILAVEALDPSTSMNDAFVAADLPNFNESKAFSTDPSPRDMGHMATALPFTAHPEGPFGDSALFPPEGPSAQDGVPRAAEAGGLNAIIGDWRTDPLETAQDKTIQAVHNQAPQENESSIRFFGSPISLDAKGSELIISSHKPIADEIGLLVRAVGSAAMVLKEEERRRFLDRFVEILRSDTAGDT